MVHRRVRGGHYKINYIKKCPVALEDELDVNITDLSTSGAGMSKIQGYIITVPKTKPRDRVRIKITHVGKKAAIGEVIE